MNQTTGPKRALFVCVGNSGRSQMAEALFNTMAKGKAQAFSAGTRPAESINPVVVEAMREIGLDISDQKPKALTLEMVEQADRLVTMGCGEQGICPATFVETTEWNLEDPNGKPLEKVREIRAEIRSRVVDLLTEWGIDG